MSEAFFFFQAEDGIRDTSVTGVQTCALPISTSGGSSQRASHSSSSGQGAAPATDARGTTAGAGKIGRASCRERGEMSGVGGSSKKKKNKRIAEVWRAARRAII